MDEFIIVPHAGINITGIWLILMKFSKVHRLMFLLGIRVVGKRSWKDREVGKI